MTSDEKLLYEMANLQLANIVSSGAILSLDQIKSSVSILMGLPWFANAMIDTSVVIRHLENNYAVTLGAWQIIDSQEGHQEWLTDDYISNSDWKFWERYKGWLRRQQRPEDVINGIDKITFDILKRLENPRRPGEWSRTGLVAGNVQSGKTANYAGLINKAIDAGYKVVIVLAGTTNDLRSQTQLRLDHDVVGYDSRREEEDDIGMIGVSTVDQIPRVHTMTKSTAAGDFNQHRMVDFNPGGDPVILVVKKHQSVLKNIIKWLKGYATSVAGPQTGKRIFDIPLLVIDDEADYASVDTNPSTRDSKGNIINRNDPSRINALIRRLLALFAKRVYVGYTATPFANLFIYPDMQDSISSNLGADLFPESFIINIPTPSNYMGPVQVFGLQEDVRAGLATSEPYPLLREVDDYLSAFPSKHKPNLIPQELPASLKEAIRMFILSSAARKARGQVTDHNSMLIHVTRFNDVQHHVSELVKNEVDDIRRRWRYQPGSLEKELFELWGTEMIPVMVEMPARINDNLLTPINFDDVKLYIGKVLDSIKLKEINGKASDSLDYHKYRSEGMTVIAIGGDKLSRGLTLEGLTTSYYLRASSMYDTLLQMGRWFGYRPGYIDLCRLYISPELHQWYRYITLAYEELRQVFDKMVALGKKPIDYGLKVRSHPAGLHITAAKKMRSSRRFRVSFADTIIETYAFNEDHIIRQHNYDKAQAWIKTLASPEKTNDRAYTWRNIPSSKIVDFINAINIHDDVRSANPKLLSSFITQQSELKKLGDWTVALISNTDKKSSKSKFADIPDIGWTYRTNCTPKSGKFVLSRNRLIDPKDEGIDLSLDDWKQALELTKTWREQSEKSGDPEYPTGQTCRYMRAESARGLMLLYLTVPKETDASADESSRLPYIGFALSFPYIDDCMPVEYDANVIFNPGNEDDLDEDA